MKTGRKSNQKYPIEQGLADVREWRVTVMSPGGGKMTREQIAQSLGI